MNPDWIEVILPQAALFSSPDDVMRCVHELAYHNVIQGGGPFSAVIVDQHLNLVSTGLNLVVLNQDSTCHAEIMAIRAAQQFFKTHNLEQRQLSLYCNCAPCIMCFGALWWSGIKNVFYSLGKEDADALGFSEGPVSNELWEQAEIEKGIKVTGSFGKNEHAYKAFNKFKEIGVFY